MEIQASELIGTWRDQRKRLMLLEQPAHNRIRLLSNAEKHQRLCPKSRIHRSPRPSIAAWMAASCETSPVRSPKNSSQSISSSGIFIAPEATSCASFSQPEPSRNGKMRATGTLRSRMTISSPLVLSAVILIVHEDRVLAVESEGQAPVAIYPRDEFPRVFRG